MVMKWSTCTCTCKYRKFVTAKVTVGGKDGNIYVLTMFSDTIAKVIDGVDGGDVKRLLAAPICCFLVDKKNAVSSVNKL